MGLHLYLLEIDLTSFYVRFSRKLCIDTGRLTYYFVKIRWINNNDTDVFNSLLIKVV